MSDQEDLQDIKNILNEIVEMQDWDFIEFTGEEGEVTGYVIGTPEMLQALLQTSNITPQSREDLN